MVDRPIIFSGPMVRALLAGRKTQTRRLASSPLARCAPGDRLYVREAFSIAGVFTDVVEVRYQASASTSYTEMVEQVSVSRAAETTVCWPRYRPSIHMPRWASRLTVVVEAVRVEPLRAISEADARAEGPVIGAVSGRAYDTILDLRLGGPEWRNARDWYADLWDGLHTKPGGRWEDNPAVVALTFKVLRGNIDQVQA